MDSRHGINWRAYRESRGACQDEVVIVFDPANADHPYIQRRREMYEAEGKVVILRPATTDTDEDDGARQRAI